MIAIAAIAALFVLFVWPWLARGRLSRAIDRGVELVATAESPDALRLALSEWDRLTGDAWRDNPEALVDKILRYNSLSDRRQRALLTYLVGVDYGDRPADWERWRDNRKRIAAGQQPRVGQKEAVKLELRWSAPIGLTASFTSILAIDRAIYVGSLGSAFDAADDPHDGVVRVDAQTGISELLFEPPERGPRDVVGLAAGTDLLVAACRNGWVYGIRPDGKLVWKEKAGRVVVGGPLMVDITRDDVADAIVAVDGQTLVCLNGSSGKGLWRSALPALGNARARRAGGVGLALGDVLADAGDELIATAGAGVYVVTAQNGRVRWQAEMPAESVGGPIVMADQPAAGPIGVGLDAGCVMWTLGVSGATPQVSRRWPLALRGAPTALGAPRLMNQGPNQPLTLVGCISDLGAAQPACVAGVALDQVMWRHAIEGEIRAAPAVANLNAERGAELIVASVQPGVGGAPRGALSVISRDGHLLRRADLEFGVETPPVVCDADGDGRLDVLIADESGMLHCFSTDGHGPVEWGLAGGDIRNSNNAAMAYSYGQAPTGYQWKWRPE
ncbi:MAG: PQQ-binding-like beta-propeller repeat protein [Phycisphaerae bacterium]